MASKRTFVWSCILTATIVVAAACTSSEADPGPEPATGAAAVAEGEPAQAGSDEAESGGTNVDGAAAEAPAVPAAPAEPVVEQEVVEQEVVIPEAAAGGTEVNHSRADQVVLAIFGAASNGETQLLAGLCDPNGETDGDVRQICGVTEDTLAEFQNYFAAGQLNGPTVVSASGETAEVPILFGPDGTDEETITLVKRDGRWFLQSF